MKKRFVMMFMAGAIAMSLCACGGKDNTEDAANATETATTQESTQESEVKVNERTDYVGYEDLEIEEYVTLPEYSSMTVQAEKPEVTDEDIENYINGYILTSYSITDRAVANGDAVLIDYVGKKDDVAFEGGTEEGRVLNIGSGTFIDGFEEGLIGVMPGETVDLNLTFPENYGFAELAGADVVFTVTVHGIQMSTDYANVTPEQIALMGIEYTSKEEMWEAATKSMEENAQATYESNAVNAIALKLVEESNFTSVPEHLVDELLQNEKESLNNLYLMYMGCDLETYVTTNAEMTMEEFEEQLRPDCEIAVKYYMTIEAIGRTEGIEITQEQINGKAAEEAATLGYESAEALIEEVGISAYRMYILEEEVMKELLDMVTVEPITAEEAAAAAITEVVQ